MAIYDSGSIYEKTEITGRFLGFYEHTKIEKQEDDGYLEVSHRWTNRPDLMALDLYGDSKYWYVIPMRNGFEDPYYDLKYGLTVVIPPKHYIQDLIG